MSRHTHLSGSLSHSTLSTAHQELPARLRRTGALLVLSATALVASSAAAQEPAAIKFENYSLPNGLQVILAEDHSAQVTEVNVWYHVGSRNEVKGRTGFAHLFEHMMFQGSANVGKAQWSALIAKAGGINNGSTTEDRTNFFQTVPSNRMNLALWIEADAMRSLAVTKDNFENQRQAVKEERRLRMDNQPYAAALFEDSYAIFDSSSCFPYSHSVIGSMADLDAATPQDAAAFHSQHYGPNNATLVVVGDFQAAEAKKLISEYFADIPKGPTEGPVACNQKFNTGTVRRSIKDEKANLPAAIVVYRVPEYRSPDYPALELLSTIIGQGESSRLNRILAREKRSAVQAFSFIDPFGPRNGPGLFMAAALSNQGVSADTVDAQIEAEMARLVKDGVTEEELTKAKNQRRASIITERQHVANVAESLQSANQFLGSPDSVNTNSNRYNRVTVADIKRVAAKYLIPDNMLVLLVTTGGK